MLHKIDCQLGMQEMESESIDIIVTSPPYNLGIRYGKYDDSINRSDYLEWIEALANEMSRVLSPTGHAWINMGYSNVDPWVAMQVADVFKKHVVLQNHIIWVKSIAINGHTHGHYKPINSARFLNTTWESIFHFTLDGKQPLNRLAVGVPYAFKENIDQTGRIRGRVAKSLGFKNIRDYTINATPRQQEEFEGEMSRRLAGKTPRADLHCAGNTWFIPYDTIADRALDRGSHPATFPVSLVERCIQLSSIQPGGKLLDPFMGSGTSAVAAIRQKLHWAGFEIDQTYADYAMTRIQRELNESHN